MILPKMADLTHLFYNTTCLTRPFCSGRRGGMFLILVTCDQCSLLIDFITTFVMLLNQHSSAAASRKGQQLLTFCWLIVLCSSEDFSDTLETKLTSSLNDMSSSTRHDHYPSVSPDIFYRHYRLRVTFKYSFIDEWRTSVLLICIECYSL